jgi:hypothetical protein
MTYPLRLVPGFEDYLDCFGDYTKTNPLCAKYCVLRLGCAIQKENNIRMEILSDSSANEDQLSILQ